MVVGVVVDSAALFLARSPSIVASSLSERVTLSDRPRTGFPLNLRFNVLLSVKNSRQILMKLSVLISSQSKIDPTTNSIVYKVFIKSNLDEIINSFRSYAYGLMISDLNSISVGIKQRIE